MQDSSGEALELSWINFHSPPTCTYVTENKLCKSTIIAGGCLVRRLIFWCRVYGWHLRCTLLGRSWHHSDNKKLTMWFSFFGEKISFGMSKVWYILLINNKMFYNSYPQIFWSTTSRCYIFKYWSDINRFFQKYQTI